MKSIFTKEMADRFIKAIIEAIEIEKGVKIKYELEPIKKDLWI